MACRRPIAARSGQVSGRSSQRVGRPSTTIEASRATSPAAIIPSFRVADESIPQPARVRPRALSSPREAPPPIAPARLRPARANWSTAYWVARPAVSTNFSGLARNSPNTPAAASLPLLGRTFALKNSQPVRPVLRRTLTLSGPSLVMTSATSSPYALTADRPSVPSRRIIGSAWPG